MSHYLNDILSKLVLIRGEQKSSSVFSGLDLILDDFCAPLVLKLNLNKKHAILQN